jgi:acetyl-CoA carboxylase carboxyl transferase subunit alpha
MMQYAWYSVISPEGCAAILWKIAGEETNSAAADALALTAAENLRNGLIDTVIPEPVGGAHRHPEAAAENLQVWIGTQLQELKRLNKQTLLRRRYDRLRRIGPVATATAAGSD